MSNIIFVTVGIVVGKKNNYNKINKVSFNDDIIIFIGALFYTRLSCILGVGGGGGGVPEIIFLVHHFYKIIPCKKKCKDQNDFGEVLNISHA